MEESKTEQNAPVTLEVVTAPKPVEFEFEVPLPRVVKLTAEKREYTLALPATVLARMETEFGGINVSRISHLLQTIAWAAEAGGMNGVTPQLVGKIFRGGDGMRKLQETVFTLLNIAERDDRSFAPFVPTPLDVTLAAFDLVELESGDVVIDPGCGDGRPLELACERGAYAIGYEINEDRAKLAEQRLSRFPNRAEIIVQDGLEAAFERADIVFLYLLTETNNKLRPLLEQKLKGTARVVSHDFIIEGPGWELTGKKSVKVDGEDRIHNVYAYRYRPALDTD